MTGGVLMEIICDYFLWRRGHSCGKCLAEDTRIVHIVAMRGSARGYGKKEFESRTEESEFIVCGEGSL
jgi:hypothetical protein